MNYRTLGLIITTGLLGIVILLSIRGSIIETVQAPIQESTLTVYSGKVITYWQGEVWVVAIFDGMNFQISYFRLSTGISYNSVTIPCLEGSNIVLNKIYVVNSRHQYQYVILKEII